MTDPKAQPPKGKRLDLPFVRKRQDVGSWAYDHRVAILVTVVAYVLFGVAFVAADIVIERQESQSEIAIDLTDLAELQKELERAQELNRMLNEQYDSQPTRNVISNDQLDESLDDHRTDAREIYDQAQEVQDRMSQNASDYAAGLHAERELLDQHYQGETDSRRVSKERGKVTVAYSLDHPIRHAQKMPVPSYMCQGGGEVVVKIEVNQNGDVVSASVDEKLSEPNNCLREAALGKARESVFNADPTAPARQKGSISYLFISQ